MNDGTPQWLKRVWAESDELPPWLKEVFGHPAFAQVHRQHEGEGDEATWWIIAQSVPEEARPREFVDDTLKGVCTKFTVHFGAV